MKKLFQIIGILTLMIGSFILTNKVQTVSRNTDELLTEIKSKKDGYKENAIEPMIIPQKSKNAIAKIKI